MTAMHELAVTQSILDLVLAAAARGDARAVTGIDLVIGDLSSVVDDSVQFYFDILSRETLAAGARLHFQREPAIAACADCGAQTPVRLPIEPACPACGGLRIQVTGGRDFRVASIDIEEKETDSP
jgi:hydrogenase nickel incorporation protein HypA/HybF